MLRRLTDSGMWAFSPQEKPLRPVTFRLWAVSLQQASVVAGPAGLQEGKQGKTETKLEWVKERTETDSLQGRRQEPRAETMNPPGNTSSFSRWPREWVSLATTWVLSQLLGNVKWCCEELWDLDNNHNSVVQHVELYLNILKVVQNILVKSSKPLQ